MQRYYAEVERNNSHGSMDYIHTSMNAVQPFFGATMMNSSSNDFASFHTTLSRGESMSVAAMNANTAAAEMNGSGSLDSLFLADEELSRIPPVPGLAVQVNGSLTDSTSSCIPPAPTMGLEALEGLERAESFRSDSMSSDISDGAADRAKGMIDPDDQFYAGAKAAYENTMNAPGGKCLKSE